MRMQYFEYGIKEIEYLKTKDPILGDAIYEIGIIKRAVRSDIYQALMRSIVGQQISTKAQETIWNRIEDKFDTITPEHIGQISAETLQACGISMRKAVYIKDMTDSILSGDIDLSKLSDMDDRQVCEYLCQIKGIGIWTAKMVMTFSMQRPDVISFEDLAIRRGLRMLYGHKKITREMFNHYRRLYSPHASVASLYIWAIAGGAITHLKDPANS